MNAQQPDVVKIGVNKVISDIVSYIYIAQERGFFSVQNLKLTPLNSGPRMLLGVGQIDVGADALSAGPFQGRSAWLTDKGSGVNEVLGRRSQLRGYRA